MLDLHSTLTVPEICSAQLVLLLIEELLDSQSIAGCRTVFSFLESRREAIIAVSNFEPSPAPTDRVQINSKNKDLVILRLCNELLRRLSRAEDPVFCGRVYIFMFQSFPLGDKSSVNLRGNFHVENVTTFEEFLQEPKEDEDSMQVDADESEGANKADATPEEATKMAESDKNKATGDKSTAMDIDTLYPVFWSLQHSFSNPPRLFEQDNFKQFQSSLEATLTKFKQVPKVIQSGASDRKKGQEARSVDDYDAFANTFNPKYLTSRDLFKLEVCTCHGWSDAGRLILWQLSDLAFQRHILVQALILIDFLLTLTERAKSKAFYQNAQKAMQYNFTLREEDVSASAAWLSKWQCAPCRCPCSAPSFSSSLCPDFATTCAGSGRIFLLSRLTMKHRPSGLWAPKRPLPTTCRRDRMANSITAWWTLCSRVTRTG
jgi:THO complex subunit 1